MDPKSPLLLETPFRSNGKQSDNSDGCVANLSFLRSGLRPVLSMPARSWVGAPLLEKPRQVPSIRLSIRCSLELRVDGPTASAFDLSQFRNGDLFNRCWRGSNRRRIVRKNLIITKERVTFPVSRNALVLSPVRLRQQRANGSPSVDTA